MLFIYRAGPRLRTSWHHHKDGWSLRIWMLAMVFDRRGVLAYESPTPMSTEENTAAIANKPPDDECSSASLRLGLRAITTMRHSA